MEDAANANHSPSASNQEPSELIATLWTQAECARQLGINRWTLLKWHAHRKPAPPRIKLGMSVYYRPEDVRAWLAGLTEDKPVSPPRPARRRRKSLSAGE